MPVFFELILSLIFFSGFYYLGKFFVNIFNLKNVIRIVSELNYQYGVIGISFFIFLIYPIFFFEIFKSEFFIYSSTFVILLGFYQIYKIRSFVILNVKNKIAYFKNLKIFHKLFFLFFLLYFLISLCPPTSGDSVAYHLSLSKYIFHNGFIPKNYFDFESKLFGSGELFNAFALSINAKQFTSFLQFVGLLSIFGLLKQKCDEHNLAINNRLTLYFFLFSCPMFIFLLASSKPQFFYISLSIISFVYLFNIKDNFNKKTIFKIFILCNIFLLTAVSAKINFSLSLFIFNLIFFPYLFKKKLLLKSYLFLFIIFCFSLLPPVIWKSEFYNFSFYNFLLNPLPTNLGGYEDYYLFLKNYDSDKFPILFFLPSSLGTFTNTLGLSSIFIFFLLLFDYKEKTKFVCIFLIFLSIMIFFGQKSPRFFLEMYILSILLLPKIYNKMCRNKIFIAFKPLIFCQSFIVALSLTWGIYSIFPANFSENLNHKILSKYADGYALYNWVNKVLPKNETIIVDHRSTFFLDSLNHMNTSALTSINYEEYETRKFYLEDIKKFKPKYILFSRKRQKLSYGKFNFEECLDGLFAKSENVGRVVARNPFNIKNDQYYDAYIYKIDYKKIPNCVKRTVN